MEPCEKSASEELKSNDETLDCTVANAVENEVITTDADETSEDEKPNLYASMSKEELVEALSALLEAPEREIKDDVASIKHAFYSIRRNELEEEKKAFVEKGNEEGAFAAKIDDAEEKLKELLVRYKDLRQAQQEALEAELMANLDKKQLILSELNSIASDPDNINRQYQRFQQLQQDFKTIGDVPASEDKRLWKEYQIATENFYDLWKINKELRDYDFKKTMEAKQGLCEEAEALANEKDVILAFNKLQTLHEKWREIGPVVKELREDLWKRFKEASTVINKQHQAYFEGRKAKEKENEFAKTAICEEAEAIDMTVLNTYAKWDEATKVIISLQERWKTLGFASKKVNNELFARFRKKCDEFFAEKATFFKKMKEETSANLAKKHQLCERAEALKDSTDWKKTAEELTALQKEWKTIGPVAKKSGDAVWKRFIAACDYFFENKSKNANSTRHIEHDNLKAKRDIIEKLQNIGDDLAKEEVKQLLKKLSSDFQAIGHVPYKEKDKVYEDYKKALDAAYDKYDINESRARMNSFTNNVEEIASDKNKLFRERERLVRVYEQKKNEIKTYENNLGFLNVTSKSGNSVLKEMEKRIGRLKEELITLEKKIEIIDEKI